MRFEQKKKTDGSAEPSAKTDIISLSDTYMHPQWRGSGDNGTERVGVNPFLLVRFPKSQRGLHGQPYANGFGKQSRHCILILNNLNAFNAALQCWMKLERC